MGVNPPHFCVSSSVATQGCVVRTRFGAIDVPVQKEPCVPMLMRTTASFAAVSAVPFTMPSETRRTRDACASTPCVVRSPISPEQAVRTRRSGNSARGRIVHTSGTKRGIVISSGRW